MSSCNSANKRGFFVVASATRRLRAMSARVPLRGIRALTRSLSSASASTSKPSPSDVIVMRDMEFFARHGALEPERALGQKFLVNVEIACDLRRVGVSDNLRDTIDYAQAWGIVREIVERGTTRTTIEAVAHETATTLLQTFDGAASVRVGIDKPHVAIEGGLRSLGVRIFRDRGDAGGGTVRRDA